ncbi:MAG: alpha/beta hydrolase [Actinomycetota bacterium]
MSGPEKRRFRVSAGELAYTELGDPENPAVVFIHGFPTSSFLWRGFLPMFAPWMRAIALDMMGAGDSDKPEDEDLSIRAQARYVRELLDGLGIKEFAVVGHSTGGGVAQLLALEGGVRAMVLIDSIAFDAWPAENTRDIQGAGFVTVTEVMVYAVVRLAFEFGIERKSQVTDEILEEYRRPWTGEEGVAAFRRWVRSFDGVGLVGLEEELGRLECPVLILWGENDPNFAVEVAERLHAAIPTSTLAILPGCSHFLPEDAPETIAPMILHYLRSEYLGHPHSHGERTEGRAQPERRPIGGEE